jgi:hypothetical protein
VTFNKELNSRIHAYCQAEGIKYAGTDLISAAKEFVKKFKTKKANEKEMLQHNAIKWLKEVAFDKSNTFLLYQEKSEKSEAYIMTMTRNDSNLKLSTLGDKNPYKKLVSIFAKSMGLSITENVTLESTELEELLYHDTDNGTQSIENSNMIENVPHNGNTSRNVKLLEITFEEIQSMPYWSNVRNQLQQLYSSNIRSSGCVNDTLVETGICLLTCANLSSYVKIVPLSTVQSTIDQKNGFESVVKTSRGNKSTYKSTNFLETKLAMFPIYGLGHFSLLCFWRLDLLLTTNSPACILWLDSLNDSHSNGKRQWRNLIS